MDLFPLVVQTRRSISDTLEALTPEQWDASTLATGWNVREMVAHMTMPLRFSTLRFGAEMLRSRGDFDAMANRIAHHDGRRPTAELAADYRARNTSRWCPPRAGFEAPLTHDVVHALDIAQPLGLAWRPSEHAARAVLIHLTTAQSLKHFRLELTGFDLCTTDLDWQHRSAETVETVTGTAVDMILALAARPAGREGLAGVGERLAAGLSR